MGNKMKLGSKKKCYSIKQITKVISRQIKIKMGQIAKKTCITRGQEVKEATSLSEYILFFSHFDLTITFF